MRFRLMIYKKRPPKKGKALKKKLFGSPKEARLSSIAQNANYYEIVDTRDKRVIEIKKE